MIVVDVDNSRLVAQIQQCYEEYQVTFLEQEIRQSLSILMVYELIYYVHGLREYNLTLDVTAERYFQSDYGLADAFIKDVTVIVTRWVEALFYPRELTSLNDIWFCKNYLTGDKIDMVTYMDSYHWDTAVQGYFGSTLLSPGVELPKIGEHVWN